MPDQQRLMFMVTHGPDEPERAAIPMTMAVGALRASRSVVVGLQGPAVDLASAGGADGVTAHGFTPLTELLADFARLGGRLLVCPASARARGIDPAGLVDGAAMVVPGGFFAEMDAVDRVLFY